MASNRPDFEYLTAVNEYGFYCIPSEYKKRAVPRLLLSGGVYEPATLRLMQRLVGGRDVVTGGAFVGDFLPALSCALEPGAQLHSFEPNPMSLAAAKFTIALNGLENVTVHPVAVGAESGSLPLQISRPGGATMGARAKIVDAPVDGATVDVEVVPLDDLIPPDRHIGLLHLDIEGHEWPALSGAKRIVETNGPTIIVEAEKPFQQRTYLARLLECFPEQEYEFCGAMERNAFFRPSKK